NPFSNYYLLTAILAGIVLMALAVYLPFFQNIFKTVFLPWEWLAGSFFLGIFNIMALEAGKWFYRNQK
ncbi:MAG: cation transporting ATPase C-terminal domain-containing protein, partial [Candidatus Brennerbacteria bacterium]|nr:cation transporting ATPase C-terminal domain-containing protein [Candidatus Brennerbacteria bacterium]